MARGRRVMIPAMVQLEWSTRYASRDAIARMVSRANDLADVLDANAKYPIAFAVERMTGVPAQSPARGELDGLSLRRGLLAFAQRLSRRAPQPMSLGDRLPTELAAEWKVSERTLRRWRDEWLHSLWRMSKSGMRLMIPASSIARAKEQHSSTLAHAMRFSRVQPDEARRMSERHATLKGESRKGIVSNLARESKRASATVRRVVGSSVRPRPSNRAMDLLWRGWLRGVSRSVLEARTKFSPRQVESATLRMRRDWILQSTPELQMDDHRAAIAILLTQRGIGVNLPRWPWGWESIDGHTRRSRQAKSAERIPAIRVAIHAARTEAALRTTARSMDAAETMVRWAAILARAEGLVVLEQLLRRIANTSGCAIDSLPRGVRARVVERCARASMAHILRCVSGSIESNASIAAVSLALERELRPLLKGLRGTARVLQPLVIVDPLGCFIPWMLRLDTRAQRRLARGALSKSDAALVRSHLGLDGEAPKTLASIGTRPSYRAWEKLSAARSPK
ncbi:MAG: hypothetical protein O2800_05440 [Planctomycetota bacterium]|nr:hypothetical protein [Planctomycetota bacterium]